IDGRKIADEITRNLSLKAQEFKSLTGRVPKLAIILVGDDEASKIYVNLKIKKAQEIGIETEVRTDLNTDADGIIVQLPGPEELVKKIPLEKDVDGLRENSPFLPATVRAVLRILDPARMTGTIVIVGQGRLIGKPLADFLERDGKTVIRCDQTTKDLRIITKQADVLVVATGVENLITADMVKKGAIVIDCGAPKAEVDFPAVARIAGAITPVPGGIGPLTVVSLLENLVEATYNTLHERR
ncbi:MAG: bifunctional 5,10-methylenetetrahydrofolate dehydrogenase/5,10-methenyltetrahydrofolate cyclohydrolase, partial [Patescibacteria group bacterium]